VAHGADGRTSCSRVILDKLLQLPQQDFLKVVQPVIELIMFLENGTPGIFKASLPYIEGISGEIAVIRNFLQRVRVSPQETEAARAFFQKFPPNVIDKLAEIAARGIQLLQDYQMVPLRS
jgi:hypothetical protein